MENVPSQSRARSWVFTLNNPSEDEVLIPQSWNADDYKYLVYQMEEGENKTPHLQGYVSFVNAKRFSEFRKFFPGEKAHIAVARGTAKQNRKYCTKDEGRIQGPWEFGEIPQQGKRSDLLATKEMLDAGASMQEVADKYYSQFLRYSRGFREYKLLNAEPRNWEMDIEVVWGGTGTGKSRYCMETYPGAYWKSKNSGQQQFWDGYEGQEVIIIDEYYGWLSWDYLLRLTDRYPFNMDIKHGTVPLSAKKIVFTSNKHPKEWYPNSKYRWDDSNPLRRRIKTIRELGESSSVLLSSNTSGDNTEENRLDDLYINHLKCSLKK